MNPCCRNVTLSDGPYLSVAIEIELVPVTYDKKLSDATGGNVEVSDINGNLNWCQSNQKAVIHLTGILLFAGQSNLDLVGSPDHVLPLICELELACPLWRIGIKIPIY